MKNIDEKILEAINTVSPKFFVSPMKVNELLKLDPTEFGDKLLLKKSGYVDIITSDYISSQTLPNSISKVYITDLGRQILKKKN